MMENLKDPAFEELVERMREFDIRYNPDKHRLKNYNPDMPLRPASVLLPLFYRNGQLHILLTIRSSGMPTHAGQVAFPGGMRAPDDPDAIATALREAEEEVGIVPSEVKVIAVLPPCIVRPKSLVTCVVALIPSGFEPQINPREVDYVFDLPLRRFLSDEGRSAEEFQWNSAITFSVYHFKDTIKGQEVDTWGFTAIQIAQTALVCYQSDVELVSMNRHVLTRKNCFNVEITEVIIENYIKTAKL